MRSSASSPNCTLQSEPIVSGHHSSCFPVRLWLQLTQKLKEATAIPAFRADQQLVKLHENLVYKVRNQLNPLEYVQFCSHVAQQHSNPVQFLNDVEQSVSADELAVIYARTERARYLLHSSSILDAHVCSLHGIGNVLIRLVQSIITDALKFVETTALPVPDVVHSAVHRAAMRTFQFQSFASQFYKHALLYLTYTPMNDIAPEERAQLAVDIGTAALVGEDTFNFGELLLHPVVAQLEHSQGAEWMYSMLRAFADGRIDVFTQIMGLKKSTVAPLSHHADWLNAKIRITALVDLAFRRLSSSLDSSASSAHAATGSERVISFADVAHHCQLPEPQVEPLLMKAFASGVISGTIDQLSATVRISHVQPRTLERQHIIALRDRITQWAESVQSAIQLVETSSLIEK